jgi:hypothetical protein
MFQFLIGCIDSNVNPNKECNYFNLPKPFKKKQTKEKYSTEDL